VFYFTQTQLFAGYNKWFTQFSHSVIEFEYTLTNTLVTVINTENKLAVKYCIYEGWNFNSGNYLFTTDTK